MRAPQDFLRGFLREAMSNAEIAPAICCAGTITYSRGYFYSAKHASLDLRQQIETCALLVAGHLELTDQILMFTTLLQLFLKKYGMIEKESLTEGEAAMDTYTDSKNNQQAVRLMVVEDEVPIADLLQYGLTREGFQVACTYTAGAAIVMAAQFQPQVILLDWMLPDMDGVELCRILSAEYNVPIIMLTARSDMEDKLKGLESGADDYITKPFDMREVAGRLRAVLRRFDKARQAKAEAATSGSVAGESDTVGSEDPAGMASSQSVHLEQVVSVSEKERVVMQKGRLIELTPKEYELLCYLLKHPREALSRQVLLEEVWGYDFMGDTRTVDIHIQRLRKKMSLDGHLLTIFGVGYKYVP